MARFLKPMSIAVVFALSVCGCAEPFHSVDAEAVSSHSEVLCPPQFTFRTEIAPALSTLRFRTERYNHFENGAASYCLAGVVLKQSLGWKQGLRLDFEGSYAHALAGVSRHDTLANRAGGYTYDMSGALAIRFALDKARSIIIEPTFGYVWVSATFTTAYLDQYAWMHPSAATYTESVPWEQLVYYGPMVGVFLKVHPFADFSMRAGTSYVMSQVKENQRQQLKMPAFGYNLDGISRTMTGSTRRQGLTGLISFDYRCCVGVHVFTALEMQALSAAIVDHSEKLRMWSPYVQRTRLSFGGLWVY